jgi:hypothetical protein
VHPGSGSWNRRSLRDAEGLVGWTSEAQTNGRKFRGAQRRMSWRSKFARHPSDHSKRLKINEVLIPPKAKLLLTT